MLLRLLALVLFSGFLCLQGGGSARALGPQAQQELRGDIPEHVIIMYENGEFKKESKGLRTRPLRMVDPETGGEVVKEVPIVKINSICTSQDGKPVPWRQAMYIEVLEFDKDDNLLHRTYMVRKKAQ